MSNRPTHIAIIMDGNGRWAESKGRTRSHGHEQGAEIVRTITSYCADHPEIDRLSLYAFSTENWKRPKIEVDFLMKLLEKYLKNERKNYLEGNIRFEPIGDLSIFSKSLRKVIDDLQNVTHGCNGLVQSLALNYGSRNEIVRAVNDLFPRTPITVEQLNNALDCKDDIDLLIRTGGDHRLSNFLLWQAAYAELFFTDTLWPEFTTGELESIIKKFKKVERRFGGLN